MKQTSAFALAAVLAATSMAAAEKLSVVGSWSSLPLHQQYEAPFWSKDLPTAAGEGLEISVTTHDQMGIGVDAVYQMLGQGIFDVGMTVADYAVGDAPELEGLDVPLVALTADEARAMVEAAKPMVKDIFAKRFNSHVLAVAPYPPQIVFCNKEIKGLSDLRGLKVRGSGRMTGKLLESLGAEGINIAFGEVPGALQRGVVDCAVTGAGSGYKAGWWEVSTHLLTLPLGGWDPVVTAVNLDKWNALSAEQRTLIESEIKKNFEDKAWADAQGALTRDVSCLTGGECALGESRKMVLVEATKEEFESTRKLLESEILPDWAERAGPEWVSRWNETVGKTVGVTVAQD